MGKRKTTGSAHDAALAELLSLLDPAPFTTDACVDALRRAKGDVAAAAELLLVGGSACNSQPTSTPNPQAKRARMAPSLRQWFKQPKSEQSSVTPSTSSVASSSRPNSPPRLASSPKSPPSPGVDRGASAAGWAALLSRPVTEKPTIARGTIHLASPAAVAAAKLPLTFVPCPLSPSFAAQLFHEMMAESAKWGRNHLYIAGKAVESNHQATGYAAEGEHWGSDGPVKYFYNGSRTEAKPYTPCLAKTAAMVEDAVNAYLDGVPRYPLEYRGRWRANVCAANRYDGAQSTVGFHSDRMTYLGPYPTIASLSLGTPRAFRLRAVNTADPAFAPDEPPRTYEVTLGNNTLVLMTPGCQERYKHTIPPQRALDTFRIGWDAEGQPIPPEEQTPYTTRINITFRFYREDFHPDPSPDGLRSGTPFCKCGFPTILRADQRGKARSALGVVRGSGTVSNGVVDDDMVYFWQCQTPMRSSDAKGCGFFKILDVRGEGRGPCWGYPLEGKGAESVAEASGTSESSGA
ncbi:hypothetical protein CspeluHIS016_0304620 [Cutaneotrichosporon spelunceum]|uniref:Fe2OG dioxygenase domain-containing protein n=1 Tax=Cutaneotrichosporon spelunceum TaxID=1672016 RepID=A0AAD3TU84_9TREE|nr:hypothetical protein CspeluHIS016_0304620 [Cutaneotrichosporon spelunceum]